MLLEKIKHMTKDVGGKHYDSLRYRLGHYIVEKYIVDDYDRIVVSVPYKYRDEYIPDIYYNDDYFGERKPRFDIQTTAYGSKVPEEIKKIIAGYQEALEAVEILTKEFC